MEANKKLDFRFTLIQDAIVSSVGNLIECNALQMKKNSWESVFGGCLSHVTLRRRQIRMKKEIGMVENTSSISLDLNHNSSKVYFFLIYFSQNIYYKHL